MKSIILLLQVSLVVSTLVGCGPSDPIALVKSGTLGIDETVTVSGALEGYEYFDEYAWSKLEDPQGRQIVAFRGHLDFDLFVDAEIEGMKLTEEIVNGGKAELAKGKVDMVYLIQFAIGKDGESFDVKYSGLEMTGIKKDTSEAFDKDLPDNELTILEFIYSNLPEPSTFGLLLAAAPSEVKQ